MRDVTIARNYAEVLLSLARKADDLPGWGAMLGDVAGAVEADDRLRQFLEAPQISAADKKRVLATAFGDRMPRLFVRYLQTLIDKRRQMLLPEIAREYLLLVDEVEGRVHASVTLAREASDEDRAALSAQLSRALGRTVVPHVTVRPEIIGGLVVRVGDTVMDGSIRRRLGVLRRRMLATQVR